jgi:glycosyltransferase involved in cell wall biosynthesis
MTMTLETAASLHELSALPLSPPAVPAFRVVHVEMGRHWVGGPNQVLSLCRGLHHQGVDSWLLCPPESPLGAKAKSLGLNVRHIRAFGDMDPRLFLNIQKQLRVLRPDIVHLHSRRGADTWGAMAARAAGVRRVILSRRVDDPPGNGLIRRMKYGPWCDHIIAISEGIRQVLLQWGVPEDKVTCVRSAIDLTPYRRETDALSLRERFGIPSDAPLVITMAQLIPRKGYRVLLEAIPQILRRVPEARFLFCGEGADRDALEQIIREKDLQHAVQLTGYITDTPSLLAAADVVAHPALREGLGIAILEAMGLGKPVVASAVGGIPEVIEAPRTGFLVPPGDATALAEALTHLLEDRELRRRISETAAERIQREFNVEGMVAGNLAVYARLLNQPSLVSAG